MQLVLLENIRSDEGETICFQMKVFKNLYKFFGIFIAYCFFLDYLNSLIKCGLG